MSFVQQSVYALEQRRETLHFHTTGTITFKARGGSEREYLSWYSSDNYRQYLHFCSYSRRVLNNQFQRPLLCSPRATGCVKCLPKNGNKVEWDSWDVEYERRYLLAKRAKERRGATWKLCNCVSHYQLIVFRLKISLNQINEANRREISMKTRGI